MAKKSFVKRRLATIEKNKRRLKAVLRKLPKAPAAPLPYRVLTSASDPLVDAASIAFQQELLLKRLNRIEDQMQMNRLAAQDVQPLAQPSITRELLQAGAESAEVLEELLEQLPEEVLADTEAVTAVLADIETGRDVIRNSRQFDRQNLLPRFKTPVKRTRRRTKTDKNMSKALRLANERFRKKNGSLRKGATQTQIMKYAHKLLRKM
ncbi:MAG: hypothetical protein [Circular genetic element sp.]|nr:MAG: hypothetical protein [Circular genetic element sp.]